MILKKIEFLNFTRMFVTNFYESVSLFIFLVSYFVSPVLNRPLLCILYLESCVLLAIISYRRVEFIMLVSSLEVPDVKREREKRY